MSLRVALANFSQRGTMIILQLGQALAEFAYFLIFL
jgi:hypothetical protein